MTLSTDMNFRTRMKRLMRCVIAADRRAWNDLFGSSRRCRRTPSRRSAGLMHGSYPPLEARSLDPESITSRRR